MRVVQITSLVVLLGGALSAAGSDWHFDLESGAIYNSNLSSSDRASEEKADWAWQSDLRVGNGFQLTRDLRLNVTADILEQIWAQYYEFNHVEPGGTIGLRYRFGLGRQAPWVLVEDRLGYAFSPEEDRAGLDNSFRLRGGYGITDRLAVEASYRFDDFGANEDFWSWSAHTGELKFSYDVTSSLQLAVGYSYRYGVVHSYALPPRPDILSITSDRRPVDTFGQPPYTAYRFRAGTHVLSATASYSFNKYFSIQAGYEFRDTNRDSLEYVNHLFEARVAFAY